MRYLFFFSCLAEYIYRKNIKHLKSTPSLLILCIKACLFIFRSRNRILLLTRWLSLALDPPLRYWRRTSFLFWENENALGNTWNLDIELFFCSFPCWSWLMCHSLVLTLHCSFFMFMAIGTVCLRLVCVFWSDELLLRINTFRLAENAADKRDPIIKMWRIWKLALPSPLWIICQCLLQIFILRTEPTLSA